MDSKRYIRVIDTVTRQVITLDRSKTKETFITQDGVEVTLYPNSIDIMVAHNAEVDATTLRGPRTFRRLS